MAKGLVFMIIGALSIVLGAVAAAGAERYPAHRVKIEQWSGGLFVGGLALLGLSMPML